MASTPPLSSGKSVQEPRSSVNLAPKASSQETSDLETGAVDEKLPQKNSNVNEINWENDDDPENPLNWGSSRKWRNLGVISVMSLTTYIPNPFVLPFPSTAHNQLTYAPQTIILDHVRTCHPTSDDSFPLFFHQH